MSPPYSFLLDVSHVPHSTIPIKIRILNAPLMDGCNRGHIGSALCVLLMTFVRSNNNGENYRYIFANYLRRFAITLAIVLLRRSRHILPMPSYAFLVYRSAPPSAKYFIRSWPPLRDAAGACPRAAQSADPGGGSLRTRRPCRRTQDVHSADVNSQSGGRAGRSRAASASNDGECTAVAVDAIV
jgi:hypothetical protein